MRQAKISLTADIRGFKKQVDDAKKALSAVGDAKIGGEAGKKLKELFGKSLLAQQKAVERQIMSITDRLKNMAEAGDKAFDVQKATQYGARLKELQKTLKEIKGEQDGISGGGMAGAAGARGGFRMLGAAAAALGVRAAFNTRTEMARQRTAIRQVTTDNQMVSEDSQFGFTPEERRQRAAQLVRAAGSVTGRQGTRLAETSEMLERAYGVTEDQSAGAVEAARKAGVQDQAKFLSTSVGTAVAAGLEGSKIGEYLQSMSGYMAEMSKGINVDDASLNGFAGAMATLPFFKSDPSRIFAALGGLDKMFKGGDMFQKAQATRGILASAPGAGPAATEFRRSMGLFGNIDPETIKKLKAAGVDTSAMEVGGGQIVQNIFDEIQKSTGGMSGVDRLYEFQQRTGLEAGPAADIFAELETAKKEGRKPNMKGLGDALAPKKSPEELLTESLNRLNKTMGGMDGKMLTLNTTIAKIGENIASNIAEPFANLGTKISDLVKALGGDPAEVGGMIGTGAAVAGGAAALGLGAKALKSGKAVAKGGARIGKAFAKGGAKGGAKAMGRMSLKLIPVVKNLVAIGFTAADAWDIGEKYIKGEQVHWEDWGALGASAASIFDPTWVAAGASIAMEGAKAAREAGMMGEDAPVPGVEAAPMASGYSMTPETPSAGLPVKPGAEGTLEGMNLVPQFLRAPTDSQSSAVPTVASSPDQDLVNNTIALRNLTTVIQQQRPGAGGGRRPSNSSVMSPGSTATGKH